MHFGVPVTWLALTPAEARQMAAALVKKADQAEGIK
jgi:hypothetical protein